jgi:hypothetical protein
VELAGQAMHSPFAGGTRVVSSWPESRNMSLKLVPGTLQTFQPLTSSSKALALSNMYLMSVTLETSQLPISWLKSKASLRLIQGRVEMCEMRFACACVNVRMRSEYIT